MKTIISVGLLVSSVAFAAPNPASTAVAPQATSATIATPTAAAVPAKKKITLGYMAESGVAAAAANRNNFDDFQSQQNVNIAYQLTATRKIQYRQYFHYNMTDDARTDEWGIGDHVVQYTNSEAAKIGAAPVASYLRFYIPASDPSKEVGKYELRFSNSVEQKFAGNLDVTYLVNTRFYTYTEDNDGLKGLRIMPGMEIAYSKNEALKPFLFVFNDHVWNHTGGEATNGDVFFLEYGIQTQPLKNVSVNIYGETGDNLRDGKDFVLGDESVSTYYLDLIATL